MPRSVARATEFLPVEATEIVVPDPGRLIFALRQIGYSLEQALSDLVDNSISAGARNVLIRFIWSGERIVSIAVIDDGSGMGESELRNAMRFGSEERVDHVSLGKFGLGLKLASFSHARTLTVAAARMGRHAGRRWTLEGIRRNWDCDVLSAETAGELCTSPWWPVDLADGGTVVLWDGIDKLPISSRGLRFTLRAIHRRLELHLGLHFHRFLQTDRLRIFVDQQEQGQTEHRIRAEIPALDPFGYAVPPVEAYPEPFSIRIPGVGDIGAEAHIWPANSDLPEYRLGNRAAARQGFYFYRNDRLIQAGGWNGVVQNDAEPHSSLARVRIDLPTFLDSSFSLNVQKSSVVVPPGFAEAVQEAESESGSTFESYRQTAQQVYRGSDVRAVAQGVPVPAAGIPEKLRQGFATRLGQCSGDVRPIDIVWAPLDDDELFRVCAASDRILLNATYRDDVLAGFDRRPDDVPLLKTLVFLLLSPDLRVRKPSVRRKKDLARINKLLVSAAKMVQG